MTKYEFVYLAHPLSSTLLLEMRNIYYNTCHPVNIPCFYTILCLQEVKNKSFTINASDLKSDVVNVDFPPGAEVPTQRSEFAEARQLLEIRPLSRRRLFCENDKNSPRDSKIRPGPSILPGYSAGHPNDKNKLQTGTNRRKVKSKSNQLQAVF